MNKKILLAVTILLLSVLACGQPPLPPTITPTPTEPPASLVIRVATLTPAPPPALTATATRPPVGTGRWDMVTEESEKP